MRVPLLALLRAVAVQSGDQHFCRRRHGHRAVKHDFLRVDLFAVDALVRVVIRAKRRSLQGNAREEPAGARIGENLRAHGHIRARRRVPAYGAGCRGSVATNFYLARKNRIRAALVHHQQNEIRSLSADLEADAAGLQSHHGRRAPGPAEIIAAAAAHRAAAVARANNKGGLEHRREYDYAIGLVQEIFRNVVGNIHDLLGHLARVPQAVRFLYVFVSRAKRARIHKRRQTQQSGRKHQSENSFHGVPPQDGWISYGVQGRAANRYFKRRAPSGAMEYNLAALRFSLTPMIASMHRCCFRCHSYFIVTVALLAAVSLFAMPVAAQQTSAAAPVKRPANAGAHTKTRADVARFRVRVEAALAEAHTRKAYWGVLVADRDSGETLYELNADHFFTPGSNSKVFTTAFALATLGTDFRFHTTFSSRVPLLEDGHLAGDLIFLGSGDPVLSNQNFPK